jgi:hypothetical protein
MDKNKEEIKKEILEIFKKLPKIIQDAITKSGWEQTLRTLVDKYNLRIDQGTQLENMTFALMMGQFSAEEYYNSILNEFDLEQDKAKMLFQEIDDNIFGSIEDIIQKLEQDQKRKELDEQIEEKESQKETYLRDDVESANMDDQILTVTRDEILKGIEDPEKINEVGQKSELPDLQDSNVMPRENGQKNDIQTPMNPETNNNQNYGSQYSNASQVPSGNEVSLEQTGQEIVEKESEIPADLPIAQNVKPQEENQNAKKELEGPIDPVEAGLNSKVSTYNKDYKGSDPYRETIE